MPGPTTNTAFKLEDELDELSYDFRTKANPDGAHGVIPEPSSKQIQVFQRKLRKLVGPAIEQMAAAPEMTMKERAELMTKDVDEAEAESKFRESLAAVAALCSNQPSVEDIAALPYRAQQAFIGWIVGVFMNPEASTPATTQ